MIGMNVESLSLILGIAKIVVQMGMSALMALMILMRVKSHNESSDVSN